ncbi:MAG: glycosyltransferase 61 family protein [Bacteroidetes bacterium]|nr:glycosyltransferase 61 family protein [Bacteroidota bacterium]
MKYYLKFDENRFYGSREHFFHLMWGYLLPALNVIRQLESGKSPQSKANVYLFDSCGPIMDGVLLEMMSLYNYTCIIIDSKQIFNKGECKFILIPRWDIWLDYLHPEKILSKSLLIKKIAVQIFGGKFNKVLFGILIDRQKFELTFTNALLAVKRNTFELLVKSNIDQDLGVYCDSYLLLKRSIQPEYYKEGGGAKKLSYGSARRDLSEADKAVELLLSYNIPVKVYEPGVDSLAKQIWVFKNCKGLIGIRGAEFANMIWMSPKSKIVMVQPSNMNAFPLQKSLARLLDQEYYQIETSEGSYPKLNGELLLKYLR